MKVKIIGGVDRLFYLEDRLEALVLKKNDHTINKGPKIIKRPSPFEHEEELILEFFPPSLNSPYTYISFERVKQKIESDYPVRVEHLLVLPMLMRNMEIPRQNQKIERKDILKILLSLDLNWKKLVKN